MNAIPVPRQLQRSQRLGWAAGSLGTAVMLGALTSFGLFYMTNYLGIGALVAGQLIGLSKFYDMLTDPLVGQLSDRTHARAGRRRPWLLAGAIGCPAAIVALFMVPPLPGTGWTVAWIALVLVLYATAFTVFNVPYLAMPAEMTTSRDERTLIMTQRIFFSTVGVLVISTLGPKLISMLGGGAQGYVRMSWVLAALVGVAMYLTFRLTAGTVALPPSARDEYGLLRQWRFLLGNRPFRFYLAAKICMFLAQTTVQGTLLFFAFYVLQRDEMILAAFGVGYTAGSMATLPFWNWFMTRRVHKQTAFRISSLGLGTVFLSWWLAAPAEPIVAIYARFLLLGVFSAGSMVSGAAMLPDIMEFDRRRTGINQEGLYAAAFSLVEKVANTLGPMLVGVLLGFSGFVAGRDGVMSAQPDSAIAAIRFGVAAVPAGLAFIAAWLIGFYDIGAPRRRQQSSGPIASETSRIDPAGLS